MSLASLLFELKPLLEDRERNFDRIVELLEKHRNLAEYEVARFYVSRHWLDPISTRLTSIDPRERLRAVRLIPLLYARATAAQHLRRMVKDSDTAVAASARAGINALGIADVSPPDRRAPPPKYGGAMALGGWNPSGWSFGLNRGHWAFRAHHAAKKTPPKLDLPEIKTKKDLAKLLDVKVSKLNSLSRPGTGPGSGYVEFEIPKRTGGMRRICAPRTPLKKVQRTILDQILAKMPAHSAAHGFIVDRSTVSNASPHIGASVVVRIDIENFFPTVHYRRVFGFFFAHYGEEVAKHLAQLTTHRPKLSDGTVVWPGALPQGAPTSPAIANLVCRRLDSRLTALAQKASANYTRYADDLTFSFRDPPAKIGRFLWWVNAILQQEGFTENVKKRRVMRKGNRMAVTGLVVNEKVGIPRDERRKFKAILANCKRHGVESQARGKENFAAWLRGYAAYVRMVHPKLGEKWQREIEELLRK